ncbi:MAG: hypothetical protein U0451_03570 [Candidatus Saccharimonadales bacterium]
MIKSACGNCVADVARGAISVDKLQDVDERLAEIMRIQDPTFNFVIPDEVAVSLERLGVPDRLKDKLYLCARQRYLGLCAAVLTTISVDIN